MGFQHGQRHGLLDRLPLRGTAINTLLGEVYDGWLMSDGYQVYRKYHNRLRCWAHLLRKAQGLEESLDQEAQRFGTKTLELLETLIAAIHKARGSPPGTPLTEIYRAQLTTYRRLWANK